MGMLPSVQTIVFPVRPADAVVGEAQLLLIAFHSAVVPAKSIVVKLNVSVKELEAILVRDSGRLQELRSSKPLNAL
jgi:hypothetical protein